MRATARRISRVLEGPNFPWVLLVPSLVLVLVFIAYPLYRGIILSFSRNRLLEGPDTTFVGLENFRQMLQDPQVFMATKNTLIYLVVGLITQITLGMAAALLLNKPRRFIMLIRLIVILPWFVPPVTTAYMWRFMLDADFGIATKLAAFVGIDIGGAGLWADPSKTLYGILFVELWRSFPFFMLFFLAGLQGIPNELLDSAAVDGASSFQFFRHVTLPLISPIIFISSLLEAIKLINSPTLVLLMTNGGPGDASLVLPLLAFRQAFQAFDFGYGSSISVAVLISIAGFAIVYIRAAGYRKED